jgi:hypothetical protein
VDKERKVKYVSIRFTPELLDRVKEVAEEEHRSVNGTVLEALEYYLRVRPARRLPGSVDDR